MPISLQEAAQRAGVQSLKKIETQPISLEETARETGVRKIARMPEEPGFFERIKGGIEKRAERVGEIVDVFGAGKQTLQEAGFQVAGQTAASFSDILGEALITGIKGAGRVLGAVTPEFIEEPVKKKIKADIQQIVESPVGRAGLAAISRGIDAWREFKQNEPRIAANVEAAFNIGELLVEAKIIKGGTKGLARPAIRGAAEVLEESAEQAIKRQKDDFIRKLIKPLQTKRIKEAQVARITEIGRGPFKRSIIAPTRLEAKAEQAVAKIVKVKPKATFQRNFNAIKETNESLAIKLVDDLEANNIFFPKKQLDFRLRNVRNRLLEDPDLVGDAGKTAQKVIDKFDKMMKVRKNTGSSLLQARKDLDNFLEKSTGGKIFDTSGRLTPQAKAAREVRREINDFLNEKATRVNVKESLAEQSALFTAMDNLIPKAAQEANNAVIRALQKVGDVLGTKSRVVQAIAAGVGIGGLGAAAAFAPAVAITGGLGIILFKAGKLVLNPKLRLGIAKLLRGLDIAISKVTDPIRLSELRGSKKVIQDLLSK